MSGVVQFRKTESPHRLVKTTRRCEHTEIVVDQDGRIVVCGACKVPLDPFDALLIICDSQWQKQRDQEEELDQERRRIMVLMDAAFECLRTFGVTPDKYREVWEGKPEEAAGG